MKKMLVILILSATVAKAEMTPDLRQKMICLGWTTDHLLIERILEKHRGIIESLGNNSPADQTAKDVADFLSQMDKIIKDATQGSKEALKKLCSYNE